MGIRDWMSIFFNKGNKIDLNSYCGEIAGNIFYKELALQASINLIAGSIARSEFITFDKGKRTKEVNYYILNVEANQNTSASSFWRSVASDLVYKQECLVIIKDQKLYKTDTFNRKEFAFRENIYNEITISNYNLDNTYTESGVLFFEWNNPELRGIIDGLNREYSKLIEVSSKSYKRGKGKKGTLEVPTEYPQTDEAQQDLKDLMDRRFKTYFEAEGDALIPLTNGLKYNELSKEKSSKTTESGGEIREFINDIFDFIAIALRIPPSLLKGNVQDTKSAVNDYLTFCFNPFIKCITDEINRKMYGLKDLKNQTYVKCDTSHIKVVDINEIANALDILTRVGAHCIDDSLKALGMEPLNTEWSKIRFMTKNYMPVEEMLRGGG